MDLWESGMVRFWVKNLIPRSDECFASKESRASARQVAIHLQDLMGAFLILGIGLGLATLCYLLELIYYSKLYYQQKHNSLYYRDRRIYIT